MKANKRHIHYINPELQNRLIIGLLLFEVLLISLCIAILYSNLNELIDANIYRAHINKGVDFELFVIELLKVLFGFLIANTILASIIVYFWKIHINSIIEPLSNTIDSIGRLEFNKTSEKTNDQLVLQIAQRWNNIEYNKYLNIRNLMMQLNADTKTTPYKNNYLRDRLQSIALLLERTDSV